MVGCITRSAMHPTCCVFARDPRKHTTLDCEHQVQALTSRQSHAAHKLRVASSPRGPALCAPPPCTLRIARTIAPVSALTPARGRVSFARLTIIGYGKDSPMRFAPTAVILFIAGSVHAQS